MIGEAKSIAKLRERWKMAYGIQAISKVIADEVRATLSAPRYGHPAQVATATGYGPCRLCLQHFTAGVDRRILFTYDAFEGQEALPLPGPIFIHEHACARYPESADFPEHLGKHRLTLEAYAPGRVLCRVAYHREGPVAPLLEELFADTAVAFVHVRDTSAGCYDLTVKRRA